MKERLGECPFFVVKAMVCRETLHPTIPAPSEPLNKGSGCSCLACFLFDVFVMGSDSHTGFRPALAVTVVGSTHAYQRAQNLRETC